jgi:hypothetical protein
MSIPNKPTNQNDATDVELPMSAPSLLEHPALKPLHPYWRSFTSKAATVVLTGKNRTLEETTTETFAAEVLKRVFELDTALAGLRIAKKFILNAVPDLGLSEFRYHYENFLSRATGINDRSHRLVGVSFRLKTKRFEATGGNKFVKDEIENDAPEIHAALTAIEHVVSSYKNQRNDTIHSNAFSCEVLSRLYLIQEFDPEQWKTTEVREIKQAYFSINGNEIGQVIDDLTGPLDTLLNSLNLTYVNAIQGSPQLNRQRKNYAPPHR